MWGRLHQAAKPSRLLVSVSHHAVSFRVEQQPLARDIRIRQCFHTVTKRFLPLPPDIQDLARVEDFTCTLDEVSRLIDETKTPGEIYVPNASFLAGGTVRLPAVPANETWSLGFIQACDYFDATAAYGVYGRGVWQVPQLQDGTHPWIMDTWDESSFPWYNIDQSVLEITGPRPSMNVPIRMQDQPHICATWRAPVGKLKPRSTIQNLRDHIQSLGDRHNLYSRLGRRFSRVLPSVNYRDAWLTGVSRNQGFYTWLILKCSATGQIHVLKTVRWKLKEVVEVNCREPLGRRATVWTSERDRILEVLPTNSVDIPSNMLTSPRVNFAQRMTWYPFKGDRTPFEVPNYQ